LELSIGGAPGCRRFLVDCHRFVIRITQRDSGGFVAKKKHSDSIKILFIGNSFTQRNDLPGLLAQMAAELDVRVKTELISVGGASLRTHWNAGQATSRIATGKYDYVVLQEQSTLPVKNAHRMAENIRLFDDVIKQAGSKTVLYMTWARKHEPAAQQAIANAYSTVGKELGAIVVPVGLAWQRFLSQHDSPVLHDRDQSHPTPAGSYLAACVFLAVLLNLKPANIKNQTTGLPEQDAQLLRTAVGAQFRPREQRRE
jgi:hypothetical protein